MTAGDGSRLREYLWHMLQAISRIRNYVRDEDEASFLGDAKTQDAVLRSIEIIGEAARNVERANPVFALAHPEIPWAVIYGMRNRVPHGYFEVDLNIVWRTVQDDLPILEARVRSLVQAGEGDTEARPC